MTADIPDFLQRFVPTPHGSTLPHQWGELRIECNDLRLVEDLQACFRVCEPDALFKAIGYLKIVVEKTIEDDGEGFVCVDTGIVRTLLRGTATILMYDAETRELLVFLAQGVSCAELFVRLIPAVVLSRLAMAPPAELQRRDIHSIAP